jgi:hypothetical protein
VKWFRRVFLLMMVASTSQSATIQNAMFVGKAFDLETGAVLYSERHERRNTSKGGDTLEVIYQHPDGRQFARKRMDFSHNSLVPEFRFENSDSGHLESLVWIDDDTVEVAFSRSSEDTIAKGILAPPSNALADGGFDRFIQQQWTNLASGDYEVREFLVPARTEFMAFRVRIEPETTRPEWIRYTLEVDSALLRFIVPPIRVWYERSNRRLMRYEGVSNVRDDAGENYQVRIEYEYAAVEDRVRLRDINGTLGRRVNPRF